MTISDFPDPEETRNLLALRSMRNKIGVEVRRTPRTVEAIRVLVDRGYMFWIDRAIVTELQIYADIYRLTAKGIALCEAAGIAKH